mmetsp:Transcript_4424/g.6675  ORF Transcript_4424/g.6675 Transcript_4424/m.6675 type:complete len:290 (-) Transcript_4424:25-894(-)
MQVIVESANPLLIDSNLLIFYDEELKNRVQLKGVLSLESYSYYESIERTYVQVKTQKLEDFYDLLKGLKNKGHTSLAISFKTIENSHLEFLINLLKFSEEINFERFTVLSHSKDCERLQQELAKARIAHYPFDLEDLFKKTSFSFLCKRCLELPFEPLVKKCCQEVYCSKCRTDYCDECRNPTLFERNEFVESFINELVVDCECGEKVTKINYSDHKEVCKSRKFTCGVCREEFTPTEYGKHLISNHQEEVLKHFLEIVNLGNKIQEVECPYCFGSCQSPYCTSCGNNF